MDNLKLIIDNVVSHTKEILQCEKTAKVFPSFCKVAK